MHEPSGLRGRRTFALAAAAVALLCHGQARAEPVTFDFTATTDSPSAPLGNTVSGYFTFESTTPPDYGGGDINNYSKAVTALQFVAGWYRGELGSKPYPGVFDRATNEIRTTGRAEYKPPYSVRVPFVGNDPALDGYGPNALYLYLDGYSGPAPFPHALPVEPPDLARFGIRGVSLQFTTEVDRSRVRSFDYRLTSLTLRRPGTGSALPPAPASEFRPPSPYGADPSPPARDAQRAVPRRRGPVVAP